MLETERLVLRRWTEEDADSLFSYASDPDVGPAAGWPAHKSREDSLEAIRGALGADECYAICQKGDGTAIGSVGLKFGDATNLTDRDDECELGYWLGKPFWGRGYMPEAARELLRRGFEDLGMRTIWCAYYDGNQKSARVQEKLGFVHHHDSEDVPVPLLGEVRDGHVNIMTRKRWDELQMAEC